jgi:hypothetical protein
MTKQTLKCVLCENEIDYEWKDSPTHPFILFCTECIKKQGQEKLLELTKKLLFEISGNSLN